MAAAAEMLQVPKRVPEQPFQGRDGPVPPGWLQQATRSRQGAMWLVRDLNQAASPMRRDRQMGMP